MPHGYSASKSLLIKHSDAEVVLRDAQNNDYRTPSAEIEELFRLQTSLMPEKLLRDLTRQQAADLLAWLESLK